MFKRIKQYKRLLFEISETLATICLMLSDRPDPIGRNYRRVLFDHAKTLRSNSEFLVNLGENKCGKR